MQRLRIEKERAKIQRLRELNRHREAVLRSRRQEEEQKLREREARHAARRPECGCHDFIEKLNAALGL